jgi:hypothetical protein
LAFSRWLKILAEFLPLRLIAATSIELHRPSANVQWLLCENLIKYVAEALIAASEQTSLQCPQVMIDLFGATETRNCASLLTMTLHRRLESHSFASEKSFASLTLVPGT